VKWLAAGVPRIAARLDELGGDERLGDPLGVHGIGAELSSKASYTTSRLCGDEA
jgi:hypothetical protein